MHLRDIDIAREEGFSRVTFLGQGGEEISVRIAEGDGNPIDRARAMMVQLAAFDLGGAPEKSSSWATEQGEPHGEDREEQSIEAPRRQAADAEPVDGEDIGPRPGYSGTL